MHRSAHLFSANNGPTPKAGICQGMQHAQAPPASQGFVPLAYITAC